MVCHIKGITQAEGVGENIWAWREGGNRRLEKLRDGKFHNLLSSPNNVRAVKSRRKRWVEHMARRGRIETYTGFW